MDFEYLTLSTNPSSATTASQTERTLNYSSEAEITPILKRNKKMARFCNHDIAPVLEASKYWLDHCLTSNEAIFTDEQLWSRENVDQLVHYFTDNPDEGGNNFIQKFEGQLEAAPSEIKKLAAEMLWFMWLFVSKRAMGARKKRELISLVWSWSGEELGQNEAMLGECLELGVGHPGTNYNTRRWKECNFFLAAVSQFKMLSREEQQELLNNPWAFSSWIDTFQEFGNCQIRHIIKFLLFPDHFERISTGRHKRRIIRAFNREIPEGAMLTDYDKELYKLRQKLEEQYGTEELDFYMPPLRQVWDEDSSDANPTSELLSVDHVLKALAELSNREIQSDERSSTYDLIYRGNRFPPKLVYSVSHKFKDGQDLDRSTFGAGEGTHCFSELRALGFVIERKDFVTELLKKFVAQADAQDDLGAREYPKEFCDLKVKVSFGAGNFSRIPWISFTGYNQTTSTGIYPVYLYYKSIGVLVLAYGVSETNEPPTPWIGSDTKEKVRSYLQRESNHTPARYGESFVHTAYQLPIDYSEPKVTKHLDNLINEYHLLMAANSPSTPDSEPEITMIPPIEEPIMKPNLIARAFSDALANSHVSFGDRHDKIIASFVSSLMTKPLAILTGLSGSGKTQIAIRFGEWLGADRMLVASVRPDWTGAEALFGYEDALKPIVSGRSSWSVPEALQFLLTAAADPLHPYLLVLDEMNLAHVERYFADVLSGMESDQPCLPNLNLEEDGCWRIPDGADSKISLPKNIFIVGTVNVDETTYMFSPKVLDRANTFEFRVSAEDLIDDYVKPTICASGEQGLVRGFLEIGRDSSWHIDNPYAEKLELAEQMRHVHRLLSQHGFEFGHRVFYESQRFAAIYSDSDGNTTSILDLILMQKLLPRLHGSRRRLEEPLRNLAAFCFDNTLDHNPGASVSTFEPDEVDAATAKLPLSFDKLKRMLISLRANQFVSFTE